MLEMEKLLFAELSYNIMGACFDVQKQLGGGHLERVYHNALKESLNNRAIRFKDEVKTPVFYNEKMMGYGYADFVVENTIVLEIKREPNLHLGNIKQIEKYLVALNLPLGILLHFGYERVIYKRVLNKNFG